MHVLKKVSSYVRCLSRREKGALAFAFASICHFVGKRVLSHAYFFLERHECECIVGGNACKCFKKVNIWTTLINPSSRAVGVNTAVKTLLQSIPICIPVCKAAF